VPKIFNLRSDPFERADHTSNTYWDWPIDHVLLMVPAQAFVGEFLQNLQGISTAPEGRELQPRRRAPQYAAESIQLTSRAERSAIISAKAGPDVEAEACRAIAAGSRVVVNG